MKMIPVDKQILTIDNMGCLCPEIEETLHQKMCWRCTSIIGTHNYDEENLCGQCGIIDYGSKFDKYISPVKKNVDKYQNRITRIDALLKKKRRRSDVRGLGGLLLRRQKAAKKFRRANRRFNQLEECKRERIRRMEIYYDAALNRA